MRKSYWNTCTFMTFFFSYLVHIKHQGPVFRKVVKFNTMVKLTTR